MNIFWDENIEFISPFDSHHLIYLGLFTVALLLMIVKSDSIRKKSNDVALGILSLSVFQQLLLYSWYFLETGFNVSEALPLHICRISSILGIYFLISKNTKVLDTMFYFGLFAYGSFIYPQRIYPVYHAVGISYVINHAVTILLPWFAHIAYGWKPTFRKFKQSSIFFLLYFTFVYFLNPIIDGNYFYLKYRPFFKQWPETIYIPFVVASTLLGFYLSYRLSSKILEYGKEKTEVYKIENI